MLREIVSLRSSVEGDIEDLGRETARSRVELDLLPNMGAPSGSVPRLQYQICTKLALA